MVNLGTSLVVQCLGVHLPIKGEGVPFLVREDPACQGATKPCSTATEASTLAPTLSIKRSQKAPEQAPKTLKDGYTLGWTSN